MNLFLFLFFLLFYLVVSQNDFRANFNSYSFSLISTSCVGLKVPALTCKVQKIFICEYLRGMNNSRVPRHVTSGIQWVLKCNRLPPRLHGKMIILWGYYNGEIVDIVITELLNIC